MANTYPFPLLDVKELVQQFRECLPEIDIKENDFTSPKAERWQVIYTVIVVAIADCSHEMSLQPSLGVMTDVEYPELLEDGLPLYKLTKCMARVMEACKVDDFDLKDINNANTKRLQKHMSAILNFLFFRNQRIDAVENIKQNQASELQRRETLIKENMDIKTEVNRIRTEREKQEPTIQEYKARCAEAEKEFEILQEAVSKKRSKFHEIKLELSERETKLADIKLRIAAAKESNESLSKKIVQSPERMKEEMNRMSKKLEELKATNEHKTVRVREAQKLNTNFVEIEGHLNRGMDQLKKPKLVIEKKKQKIQETQSLRDGLIENRNKLQNLETKEQQLSRLILGKEEKQSKLALAGANKIQSMENTNKMMREEKELIQGQQSDKNEQKENLLHGWREEERKALIQHQDVMATGHKTYLELLDQLEHYHARLAEANIQTQQAMDKAV